MAGMDFLVNFAASIASTLVCGAIREGRYCCCFSNFVEDLKKEKKELQRCKESMDDRIRKAKEETKNIDNLVKQWLLEAEILEKEASQLEEKAEKHKTCIGHCPNWVCRSYLSRQLAKKTETIKQHCEKSSNFKEFARLASLPGMKYYSSENFMNFDSRHSSREQLMKALNDNGVSMIGLYGMGGCGKTTLAKEVGKVAEGIFRKVIFVVVSSNEEVRKIQDRIASSLRFELDEKEEPERAKRLCMRLSRGDEKILIILDDVWKRLDFEVIGIPSGRNHKGCKVLMTTRSLSVCNLMGCQETIYISLLSRDEPWALFKNHACITDNASDALKDLGKEITDKCKGLPIAIAAVASTLKGKFQDEWEVALQTLKDSRPVDLEEGLPDPYTCLELSYNYLKSQEAKNLFLLCSTFPEDWDIDFELLTRCGIGLGLVEEASSYIMRRKKVNVAKRRLIDSCLLLEANKDGEECVRMHDLVRDVALWIANKENKVIMGREISEIEEDMTIKDNRIRYMCCNKFPNRLDCSKLEFLYVCTDSKRVQVPQQYFKGKKKLHVLVLENVNIRDTPVTLNSIQTLKCLRCLVLIDWELDDISFIGCLKVLESLTLKGCSIQKLPEAMEQLKRLRLLEISKCEISINPYEVIGNHSYLEELYFTGNDNLEWEFDNETAFELLGKFSVPKQLQQYHIELGKREKGFKLADGSISRILSVEYFNAPSSNAAIMDLVRKTESLSLGHIKGGYENIIPDFFRGKGGSMNKLVELVLHDSEEIKCLIDNTNDQYRIEAEFSKLSKLWIERMEHLEVLCNGHPSPGLFKKLENMYISGCDQLRGVLFVGKLNLCGLKVLEVKECPKLTSIFTPDSARSLSQLQNLLIDGCNELEHIITEQIAADEEYLNAEYCPNIASNSCPVHSGLVNLCSLKKLILKDCPILKSLFTLSTVWTLSSLEILDVSECHGLKEIINCACSYGCKNEGSCFQSHVSVLFPKLYSLDIKYCNLLECIFPVSFTQGIIGVQYIAIHETRQLRSLFTPFTAKAMTSLVDLEIRECHGLKEIITCESGHESKSEEIIQNDSGLRSHDSVFPKLRWLDIQYCNSLQCIFPVSLIQDHNVMMSLESIRICEAPKLQYVFGEDRHEHHSSYQCQNMIKTKLPIRELTLSELPNLISIWPKNCYVSCPRLWYISLDHVGLIGNLMGDLEDRHWDFTPTEDPGATTVQNFGSATVQNRNSEERFAGPSIGPIRLLNLQYLEKLLVDGCGKLKAIFSVSVLRSLPWLRELTVIECEELEQIIIEDKENENMSNHYPQNVCLPELEALVIIRCNKLKHLFSISTFQVIQKLEYLIIKEASKLEEVFESGKGETKEGKELVFPQLECLMLVELPSLTNVCQGIEFQNVTCRIVQNCPNLSLTSALQEPEELEEEIDEEFDTAVASELVSILRNTVRETLNKAASGSRPPSSQKIEEVMGEETVGNDNASKTPAKASSSTDSELRKPCPIPSSVLSNDQQEAPGEATLTAEVPHETSKSSDHTFEAMVKKGALKDPKLGEDAMVTLSGDLAQRNTPPTGSFAIESLQKKSLELMKNVSRSDIIIAHQTPLAETRSTVQSNASQNDVTEGVQDGLLTGKAIIVASSPQKMANKDDSVCKAILKEQPIWQSESSTDAPNLPSDHAQAVLEPQTDAISEVELRKTLMGNSLAIPKLKGSSLYPSYGSLDKTFSQISPNHALSSFSSISKSMLVGLSSGTGIHKFTLSTEFSSSRLIIQSGVLQELKTKLAEYFNMTLEDVLKANAFDDVENTVNSLAEGTTDAIEKNILEDISDRLKYFKECVPKAISNVQSSLEFISNNESLNVELNTKLSEGGEILRELESKLSEICGEENVIEMEIQQLITRKMEILAQKNSLVSQCNRFTEAVSKDYDRWKVLGEELKQSTENWLKSKEDLAHANASWKLFKESLGL